MIKLKLSFDSFSSFTSVRSQNHFVIFTAGSLLTMQMTPDNPGEWKLVCRVNSNLRGGMVAKYIVQEDCGTAYTVNQMKGRKRQYFIAAIEETWDYAPSGQDLIEGKELEYSV